MTVKLWLDNNRQAPDGWLHIRKPHEAIEWLAKRRVVEISLDYELGDGSCGTGYDILLWIEQATMLSSFRPPDIRVHTSNLPVRHKMLTSVAKIRRIERSRRSDVVGAVTGEMV